MAPVVAASLHFLSLLSDLQINPGGWFVPVSLSVQVYPVAAPVAVAAALFSYMITRTIVSGEHCLFLC